MKLGRCPVCHNHLNLEAIAQDEAGKELMAILAKLSAQTASSVLSYMGLFRPFKSDLNNGKALRLLSEVLAFSPNQGALCQALDQTTQQISQSRAHSGDVKPLANHNYLKKVLTSIQGWDAVGSHHEIITRSAQNGKTAVSHAILDIHGTDWASGLEHD